MIVPSIETGYARRLRISNMFVGLVNPRALLIFAGLVVVLVLLIVYVRWRLTN